MFRITLLILIVVFLNVFSSVAQIRLDATAKSNTIDSLKSQELGLPADIQFPATPVRPDSLLINEKSVEIPKVPFKIETDNIGSINEHLNIEETALSKPLANADKFYNAKTSVNSLRTGFDKQAFLKQMNGEIPGQELIDQNTDLTNDFLSPDSFRNIVSDSLKLNELTDFSAEKLPPLDVQVLDRPNIEVLKGKQIIDLPKIKMDRRKITEDADEIIVSKKRKLLPKKIYFDGIIALPLDFSVINFSPNFGYNFSGRVSGGLGLDIKNSTSAEYQVKTALGYKAFVKFNAVKDRLYLQTESTFFIPEISYFRTESDYIPQREVSFLVGASYELDIGLGNYINITALYNVNKIVSIPNLDNPLVIRLGIGLF